jgi:hypothetical protein
MSYQVFISHSSQNADIASAMKGYLEGNGIKCWKAPEDIPFGMDWDVGIKKGLAECPVMVLIFTRAADESKHVKIEVHKASEAHKIVIPFKVEDYIPDNLDYYLTFPQWLEAIGDVEGAFEKLLQRLKSIVQINPVTSSIPEVNPDIATASVLAPAATDSVSEKQSISDRDREKLLSIIPEFGSWATNAELRERLNWSKEKLKDVANSLDANGTCIYRDGSGGALAIKTDELAELEQRLTAGVEPYPYFVNVGEGPHRHWDDCRKYSFFCAGHGERFANQMQAIPVGSEVFLYLSQYGYVAMAKTTSAALPMDQYQVGGIPIAELPLVAPKATEFLNDHLMCEWLISVDWLKSLDRNEALRKKGLYVHVATSCRIKDPITIQYLRKAFAI